MKRKNWLIPLGLFLLTIPFIVHKKKQKPNIEDAGEHPGYFKQWFEMKKNKDGIIPAFRQSKWMEHDASMQKVWNRRTSINPIEEVKELGPTYVGGRTRAIWVNPDNENIMLAGGVSGGMWRSTDAGSNWNPLNNHQASMLVTTITMNPFKHNELYYGTGEHRGENLGISGEGIFKSIDGGKSFKQLENSKLSAFKTVSVIRHSYVADSVVYVGTQNTTDPFYYSTNSGKTFKAFTPSLGRINDMEVFPDDKILVGVTYSGIYKIKPGLNGFTKITSSVFPTSFARVEIEYCKAVPKTVYAFFEGRTYSTPTIGVFKSTDGGETWVAAGKPNVGTAQGRYCIDLAVHPTNPNRIMAAAVNLAWSYNGGQSWINGTKGHSDHHTHAYLKGNYILLGNDGGVYRHNWTSRTQRYSRNNGYKVTQFYAGGYGPTGDTWIAGTQDNGTHRLLNGMQRKVNGADGGYAFISQQNTNIAYLSQQNASLKKSTNFSTNTPRFKNILPSKIAVEGVNFINAYYMNNADGNQLYYRTNKGIWRTTSAGSFWDKISTATSISAITSSNETDPVLYYGRSRGTFFRKVNAASSTNTDEVKLLKNQPREARFGSISGIEVHPKNRNTVFLAFGQNGNNSKIWKVENCDKPDDLKWTDIAGDLSKTLPVNDIAVHPQDPNNIMLAATDYGLYYTINGGKKWVKDTRVPSVAIFKIELRPSDRHAFLFTHGRGVWRVNVKDATDVTGIKTVKESTFKIFPNPVTNGLLTINFDKKIINRKARVLTINGQEVLRINATLNQTSINVSNLKSGIYMVEVLSGNIKSHKKVLITN